MPGAWLCLADAAPDAAGFGWLEALLVVAGGILAGIVNTIAGGGSFLTLPLLMEAGGLSATVANGTNRVGIVLQNVVSVSTFHRHGHRDYAVALRLAGPMALGALGGAWLAARMEDQVLRPLFGGVLLFWAVYLCLRPARFDRPPGAPRPAGPAALLISVAVGAYGGFLQAGVGFPTMALLVLGLRLPPVRANGVKVVLILVYTGAVALPVFLWHDQVSWSLGLVLAAGTMVGGWIGTRWQLKAGAPLVRWVLVLLVAVSGVRLLM